MLKYILNFTLARQVFQISVKNVYNGFGYLKGLLDYAIL